MPHIPDLALANLFGKLTLPNSAPLRDPTSYCPLAWARPQFHHQVRGPHAVHWASIHLYAWDCPTGKERWSFLEGLQSPAHFSHKLHGWAQGLSSSPHPLITNTVLPTLLQHPGQLSFRALFLLLPLFRTSSSQTITGKTFSKSPMLNHYPYSYFNTLS